MNPGACLLFGDLVQTVLIEPSLGFFFTQTGFRCAKPPKKGFEADRCQFVDLLGNACALSRLFVLYPITKVYGGSNASGSLAFAFVKRNVAK